jgi:hypothetical protein
MQASQHNYTFRYGAFLLNVSFPTRAVLTVMQPPQLPLRPEAVPAIGQPPSRGALDAAAAQAVITAIATA